MRLDINQDIRNHPLWMPLVDSANQLLERTFGDRAANQSVAWDRIVDAIDVRFTVRISDSDFNPGSADFHISEFADQDAVSRKLRALGRATAERR